jgi:hypothetical protein
MYYAELKNGAFGIVQRQASGRWKTVVPHGIPSPLDAMEVADELNAASPDGQIALIAEYSGTAYNSDPLETA